MVKIIGKSAKRVRKPKANAKPHTNSPKILKPTAISPLRPKGAGKCAAVSEKCCSLSSPWLANVNPNTRREANNRRMSLYFQLLETIILNFSSLTIFCIYIFLPLMLLHSTFNNICGFVWHVACGIVILTACKDRASFLFCPKIHHKVCRERQKYHVCGIC